MKLSYFMIHVRDLDESIHFYRDLLGMELERTYTENECIEVAFLVEKGQRAMIDQPIIELVCGFPNSDTTQSGYEIGFSVDSVSEISTKLMAAGYRPVNESVVLEDNMKTVKFNGPEGIKIELVQQNAMEE